jgi:hypothetical protein
MNKLKKTLSFITLHQDKKKEYQHNLLILNKNLGGADGSRTHDLYDANVKNVIKNKSIIKKCGGNCG